MFGDIRSDIIYLRNCLLLFQHFTTFSTLESWTNRNKTDPPSPDQQLEHPPPSRPLGSLQGIRGHVYTLAHAPCQSSSAVPDGVHSGGMI